MSFLLPQDVNISTSGWGPETEPEELFKSIPYAPFSKSEKLGKAADWNAAANPRPYQSRNTQNLVSTAFNVFEEEDDDFSIVDNRVYRPNNLQRKTFVKTAKWTRPVTRVKGGTNWQNEGKRTKLQQRTANTARPRYAKRRGGGGSGGGGGGGYGYGQKNRRRTELSVEIMPSWGEPVKAIDFTVLTRSTHPIPQAETLSSYGALEEYNNIYDTATVRKPIPIERQWSLERTWHQVSTSDDAVLRQLREKESGNVYATDAILAVLMSCVVSAYSWDLVLTIKEKPKTEAPPQEETSEEDEDEEDEDEEEEEEDYNKELIFDKIDGSSIDFLDVNENSNDPPPDEDENPFNTVEALSKEVTFLNYNYAQQICHKTDAHTLKFPLPSPFQTSDEKAACNAYFYRRFDVADSGLKIVARTEVNGYRHAKKKQPVFMFIRAMNEYDPKITGAWRKVLETQKAGAFATELKNNSCKMTKWLAQAHLAGAKEIRLGWVSRNNFKDSLGHSILDQSVHTPEDFSNEIATGLDRLWGVLVNLLKELRKLPGGEYRLVRDPQRKTLFVYRTK